jgi:allantoin racemase
VGVTRTFLVRIKVDSPNTTVSMTKLIGAAARAVAGPGVEIDAVKPQHGPAEGHRHLERFTSQAQRRGETIERKTEKDSRLPDTG